MKIEKNVELLRKRMDQFVKLVDNDWELILPHLEYKEIKKHGFFSKEGKRSNEVGFIVTGQFRQYYTVDGGEKTTWFFFEHDLLCSYISCITTKPSLISIEALSDATYLSFPYTVLENFYKESLPWQTFGRRIAEYIAIGLEDRMVGLLTQKPEYRYRKLLMQSPKLIEQIPLQYVANYLGITPVSMSRIRRRFYTR